MQQNRLADSAGDEEAGVEKRFPWTADIVDLQGKPVPMRGRNIQFDRGYGSSFSSELIFTQKAIRKKYRLADDVWNALGNCDNLVRVSKRNWFAGIRDGSCKRENS